MDKASHIGKTREGRAFHWQQVDPHGRIDEADGTHARRRAAVCGKAVAIAAKAPYQLTPAGLRPWQVVPSTIKVDHRTAAPAELVTASSRRRAECQSAQLVQRRAHDLRTTNCRPTRGVACARRSCSIGGRRGRQCRRADSPRCHDRADDPTIHSTRSTWAFQCSGSHTKKHHNTNRRTRGRGATSSCCYSETAGQNSSRRPCRRCTPPTGAASAGAE